MASLMTTMQVRTTVSDRAGFEDRHLLDGDAVDVHHRREDGRATASPRA